jgi:ribonucleotide monophosphatase NagD (HAD superfamily)
LAAQNVHAVGPDEGPDAVVVGRTVELDYWALSAAAAAIRAGARFVATNTDPTLPVGLTRGHSGGAAVAASPAGGGGSAGAAHGRPNPGDGLLPGAGAIVAFIATASGRAPEVAGKPEQPMAALVSARYGVPTMVVGDQPDTDGLFAVRLGTRFGLVLSGVTRPSDLPVRPAPDLVGSDLADLVRQALARSPG